MQHEYVDSAISSYHLVLICTEIIDNASMGWNPQSLPEPITQWKLTNLVSGFFNNLIGFGVTYFYHEVFFSGIFSTGMITILFGLDYFLLSFFSVP